MRLFGGRRRSVRVASSAASQVSLHCPQPGAPLSLPTFLCPARRRCPASLRSRVCWASKVDCSHSLWFLPTRFGRGGECERRADTEHLRPARAGTTIADRQKQVLLPAFPRPPNGLRQPRAGGLARTFPNRKALYPIPARKIAHVPASRLHAMLGRALPRLQPTFYSVNNRSGYWVNPKLQRHIGLWSDVVNRPYGRPAVGVLCTLIEV
jgi:hypothetical protein